MHGDAIQKSDIKDFFPSIDLVLVRNTLVSCGIGKEVAKVPPGCEGLVMLPHLQGAMAPEANPKAKGVFYGFTLKHTKPYFARAIMEAIACIVRRNIEVLEELHIPVNEIRVLGGGARSDAGPPQCGR